MFKPLILATIMALVPASSVSAGPQPIKPTRPGQSPFDPTCAFCYYDYGAKDRKEREAIERLIAEERIRAEIRGFASKSERKQFDRQLEKAREQIYKERYGKK